jgi:hypothetical protein
MRFILEQNYFRIDESLVNQFMEVEELADISRHLALRFSITNNPEILIRLGACLDQILSKEKEAILELLRIWPN